MNWIDCLIRFLSVNFIYALAINLDSSKFVYKQDISEYCRRKVTSSVFLGNHVVESNSKMIHFSQLDIPYSCFVTIRTESGNHIILFVQVQSRDEVLESCREHNDQLLAFQMSETFGGFWALPPKAISRDISALQSTLYTMPSSNTETPESTEIEDQTYSQGSNILFKKSGTRMDYLQCKVDVVDAYIMEVSRRLYVTRTKSQEPAKVSADSEEETKPLDVIAVEVPILNATGRLVSGDEILQAPWDGEENVDKFYDATPKDGISYDRTIVPLVQIWANKSGRRNQEEPLFDISYNEDLLRPSPIIQMLNVTESTTKTIKGTTKTTTTSITTTKTKILSTETVWKPYILTSPYYKRPYRPRSTVRNIFQKRPTFTLRNKKLTTEEYWSYSQTELLKSKPKMNLTTMYTPGTSNYEFHENTNLWEGYRSINKAHISRLKDFTSFTKNRIIQSASENPFKNFMKFRVTPLNERPFQTAEANYPLDEMKNTKSLKADDSDQSSSKVLSASSFSETTEKFKVVVDTLPTDNTINNFYNVKSTNEEIVDIERSVSNTPMDVSSILPNLFKSTKFDAKRKFVNHESWENLVHSAPEMVLLAKSKHEDTTSNESYHETLLRKKRYLEKISIQNARPENIFKISETTTDYSVEPDVKEDLSQLLELSDDETTGRVSLHEIWNFIGTEPVFNVCDYYNESKDRHVILLNTSRVILLLNNYTLKGMTIVTTSANTLYDSNAKCNQAQLECQVQGHRVCVESSCACDGVPNCGSYDIYDEDRLRCQSTETHYDIYLAILAFLGLLLTMIYTVYFWLQRCVPQVSKAFFVYIAGTENDLYLKTIMRSPYDMDDVSKLPYHPDEFETSSYFNTQQKVGVLKYLFLMCIRCLTCSENKKDVEHKNDQAMQHMFSFTEFEINKMGGSFNIDVAVQTGDSLEKMNDLEKLSQFQKHTNKDTKLNYTQMSKPLALSKLSVSTSNTQQEMKLLNMFNKSRSDASTATVPHPDDIFEPERNHDHEKELYVFDLHKHGNSFEQFGDSISSNNEVGHEFSENTKKKLRFEDSSEMSLSNDIERIASTSHKHKMHPLFGMFRRGDADFEAVHEDDYPEYGQHQTGHHESQLKRFWNREQHKKKTKRPGNFVPMRKL